MRWCVRNVTGSARVSEKWIFGDKQRKEEGRRRRRKGGCTGPAVMMMGEECNSWRPFRFRGSLVTRVCSDLGQTDQARSFMFAREARDVTIMMMT